MQYVLSTTTLSQKSKFNSFKWFCISAKLNDLLTLNSMPVIGPL
jgi:hypothetical protein